MAKVQWVSVVFVFFSSKTEQNFSTTQIWSCVENNLASPSADYAKNVTESVSFAIPMWDHVRWFVFVTSAIYGRYVFFFQKDIWRGRYLLLKSFSFQGRCVICGGPGISDAYFCKECTIQEKDRDGCPKIVNLGSSKTDLFYERKKYGFKKR